MSDQTPATLPRLQGLQALRAFAAFGISMAHLLDLKVNLFNAAQWPLTKIAKDLFDAEGGAGVDIFFVLSGFLISSLHTGHGARSGMAESIRIRTY